jgi:hypothetical protein
LNRPTPPLYPPHTSSCSCSNQKHTQVLSQPCTLTCHPRKRKWIQTHPNQWLHRWCIDSMLLPNPNFGQNLFQIFPFLALEWHNMHTGERSHLKTHIWRFSNDSHPRWTLDVKFCVKGSCCAQNLSRVTPELKNQFTSFWSN